MSRSTVRLLTAGAMGAVLVSTLGMVATQSSGTSPTVARVAPGERASVSGTVPVSAKAKIQGKRVTRKIARPTRLQKLSGTTWQSVGTRASARTGRVTYAFTAPSTTTSYRIIAPTHRVRLTRTVDGRKATKRVVLRAWTGPAQSITVAPAATQTPTQQPTQQPTQDPPQTPTQTPTEPPTPRLSLLTPRANTPGAYVSDVSTDESGQVVAFTSGSPDLVPGDDNNQVDVFVTDTRTGVIELVSRVADGTPGDDDSRYADISPDGRYVAFTSRATDIGPANPEGIQQVYLFDRITREVELSSATRAGVPGASDSSNPSVSRDGKYVAFATRAVNLTIDFPGFGQLWHVVRHERSTGENWVASFPRDGVWAGNSGAPSLSADGGRVAFTSGSDHLVAEDDNSATDVFLYDFDTWVRQMLSRKTDGSGLRTWSSTPLISGDGNAVVWQTEARNVVAGDDNDSEDAFRYDVLQRTNTLLSRGPDGRSLRGISGPLAVDADGSEVLLWSTWQTHGTGAALYLCDVSTGALRPLGLGPDGVPYLGNAGALSAGGDRVAFGTGMALTPDDTAEGDDVYLWEFGA